MEGAPLALVLRQGSWGKASCKHLRCRCARGYDGYAGNLALPMAALMAMASFTNIKCPTVRSRAKSHIKSLLPSTDLATQSSAFKSYHESQFTTAKLPGSSTEVVVSPFNDIGDGRYHDAASQTSFAFDHVTGKASAGQSAPLEGRHAELVRSLLKAFGVHAAEHYPSSAYTVCSNRIRRQGCGASIAGSIKVDVHYYEDGNVRLLTEKPVSLSASSSSASDIVKQIVLCERRYQEDLNRAFTSLNEGAFKSLRRQLPVTRQKIEWEKISGYRLGQDIGGRTR
ncbi:hypothetical protein MRB53_040569 [Persea americana]|nr:hypothetical protein MRB53_040569 [Persea americana]